MWAVAWLASAISVCRPCDFVLDKQLATLQFHDSEIVYRVKKKHHAGLILRSKSHERVSELLNDYGRRFENDFIAVLPPLERPE